MSNTSTDVESTFPWDAGAPESGKPLLHLVVAFYFEDTSRVGDVVPLEGNTLLGRGAAAEHRDDVQRASFFRQRPLGWEPRPPLESRRISREQLELTPRPDGTLAIRSVGRAPMLVNGDPATSAVLQRGDTISLGGALVLLVTTRPRRFPALRHLASQHADFAFGEPDRFGLVGESPSLWQTRDQLAFAARAGGHVLITGESGTGKELVARAIHELSSRRDRPFVSRNAATFPEGLIDAELFGTAKDYPNAGMPRRSGLIGDVDGGTLFLDELGEMAAGLQSHLLRVLDRGGEYQQLGDTSVRRSGVSLVAATNRDPAELKHDLVARLKLRLAMAPLADRVEDIPLLVRHVLNELAAHDPSLRERFHPELRVEPALIDVLLRHRYTHHMRELERLVLLAIQSSRSDYVAVTSELERELVIDQAAERVDVTRVELERALSRAGGSATKASRLLGLKNRYALYRLLKKHGISGTESE